MPRPRHSASLIFCCSLLDQLCEGGVTGPVFWMTSPRCKEICSFFPWPQLKAVLGLEPGADQLLPAGALVLRGGNCSHRLSCCPERASLPKRECSALTGPVSVSRAPMVPRYNCRLLVSVSALISPSFGDSCTPVKVGQRCPNSISSFTLQNCLGGGEERVGTWRERWPTVAGCLVRTAHSCLFNSDGSPLRGVEHPV